MSLPHFMTSFNPNNLPKTPPFQITTSGVGLQLMNFEEDTNIASVTPSHCSSEIHVVLGGPPQQG